MFFCACEKYYSGFCQRYQLRIFFEELEIMNQPSWVFWSHLLRWSCKLSILACILSLAVQVIIICDNKMHGPGDGKSIDFKGLPSCSNAVEIVISLRKIIIIHARLWYESTKKQLIHDLNKIIVLFNGDRVRQCLGYKFCTASSRSLTGLIRKIECRQNFWHIAHLR